MPGADKIRVAEMQSKQIRPSKRLLFWSFVLAGLISLLAPQKLTNKVQFAFAHVFRRPLAVGSSLSRLAFANGAPTDVVSGSKYRRLRNFHANTVLWLHQERQKVENLSQLRDRTVWEGVNFVLADVITATINEACGELLINRGENDGLAEGQLVLGDYSIIGTISDVDSRLSRLKLITDPTSKVAVSIADVDVRCVMQGSGNCSAKIELLPIKHKIGIGDTVWARKKPGFLDTPITIGTVARCTRNGKNPLIWDITVKPACDIERLNNVTVIIVNPKESN